MTDEKTETLNTEPEIPKWKVPIWISSNAQLIRVLRYEEVKAILNELDVDNQGAWHIDLGMSSDDLAIWLQTLLLTGMRFKELWKFREHPEALQTDKTILLAREVFYDTGKKKQLAMERTVQLSDMGRAIMDDFLHTRISKKPFRITAIAIDHILENTALQLGFQSRTFKRKLKEWLPSGNYAYNYVDLTTTGVRIRSFRKTWDTWLINTFASDPIQMAMIYLSQGHDRTTSLNHYLTFGLDKEDKEAIRKAMKGYGGWEFKE